MKCFLSRTTLFNFVVSIRLFQLILQAVKVHVLKELGRVSIRWLVVELMYVPSMREFGKVTYLLYKLLGRDDAFPVLDQDVLDAGWVEYKRIPLRGMKNWIGIYRKDAWLNRDWYLYRTVRFRDFKSGWNLTTHENFVAPRCNALEKRNVNPSFPPRRTMLRKDSRPFPVPPFRFPIN